jgi:acyl-CoA thioesterase-1
MGLVSKATAMRRFLFSFLLIFSCSIQAATVLVLGDSLSAGYGLASGEGWVTLMAQRMTAQKLSYTVVNASISGDTSAGGLSRLDASLDQSHPAVLLLELGANDGLRGLPLTALRRNLETIITRAQARGVRVVLIGMHLPPNYGESYTAQFHRIYIDLAARHHLPFVPFLLDGVALNPALMQADGLHPTAAAQPRLLDTVWRTLGPLLRQNAGSVR